MQYRTFEVESTGIDNFAPVNKFLAANPAWTLWSVSPTGGTSGPRLLCVLEGPTPRPTKPGAPTGALKDGAQLTEHTNVRRVNFDRKVA